MDRPVLVCGLGVVGRRVLDYLVAAGFSVTVIDDKADPAAAWPPRVRVVRGDFREPAVLRDAGLADAAGVLILASDERSVLTAALAVRRLHPTVRLVLRMFNQNIVARLGAAVPEVTALSASGLAAPVIARTALRGDILAGFALDGAADERQVADLEVGDGSPLAGLAVRDAAARFRFTPLSHRRDGLPHRHLHDIDPADVLRPGDVLTACAAPADLAALAGDDDPRSPRRSWFGRSRRVLRVLRQFLADVDLPVFVCTAVLAAVVLGSATVYHYGMNTSWPDGLYKTISVIATGADLGGREYVGWQKVFVSLLRLTGMAATAAFTAILTQYLLRARLGDALEARRIPDAGHVLVCGLGNVGFRVVEELVRLREPAVVIERDEQNRFVPTCRRMGVPVVVGDATVTETLRQARADTARAAVATTDAELTNLEIALLVRDLNPGQRVVVRVTDPRFAEGLREAADVRHALSVPDLAAPAFVAALFGDHVRGVLRAGPALLLIVEIVVQQGEENLDGRLVGVLAVDHGLVPVAVVPAAGKAVTANAADHRLRVGDRLFAVTTPAGLEGLYRVGRPPEDWSLEITGMPPTARPTVETLLALHGEAKPSVEELPYRVARRMTRGEAADLARLLERERVGVRVVPTGATPPASA